MPSNWPTALLRELQLKSALISAYGDKHHLCSGTLKASWCVVAQRLGVSATSLIGWKLMRTDESTVKKFPPPLRNSFHGGKVGIHDQAMQVGK